jgi:uncharacterized protein
MFGFIPKEEKFFKLFKDMTENIIVGAKLLKDMLDNFENPLESQRRIKDIEHKGDSLTHEIIQTLNKTFITPLDREDIYALASKLDDILDLIDASAQRIIMYNVEAIPPEAKSLGFIILQSCHSVHKAVAMLGNKATEQIFEACVEINSLENEADRVSREAISRLFDEEKDPIQLIKWKEIFETLEKATDRCEDVSNILESVVVKNG